MWIAIAIGAVIFIIILAIIGMYNNLVSLKMRVKNAWAQIDTQLKRRFDLIPNLVETVKGYAQHEQSTLDDVIKARNNYVSANSVEDKASANTELNATLKNLFALAESYPDLKANENFMALQTELSGTEDKIAYSRQFYNDTVTIYNTKLETFPSNLVASMFGFKASALFNVDNEEAKKAVKVDFNN